MVKKITIALLFFLFYSFLSFAQNTFKTIVKDYVTRELLMGVVVSVENTTNGTTSNERGEVLLNNVPDGNQRIAFYLVGYKKMIAPFYFPQKSSDFVIYLVPSQTDLEEITVSSTRTNSRIDDLPTKVEVLGQEDMDEESTIVPGNVTSILGDLSIITIQRTNQINGNEAIRMQGLDAKYTQIMRDGLPLYGGFSGSLGVLAIPPLDLKQVEIIKGSASTLYGGGAIGGLINFISKTPKDSAEAVITLNATTLGEGNVNAFASGKKKKLGATLFTGINVKQATDINGEGFTDIPSDENYSIHPRLFFEPNSKTTIIIGISSIYDKRKGGDIDAVIYGPSTRHPFLQEELSFRNTIDLSISKQSSKQNTLILKTAASAFQRDINYSGFIFNGTQYSSYSEINDLIHWKKHTLVIGLNFISENFVATKIDAPQFTNYNYYTTGSFLQDDWQVFKKISFQLGLRYDYHNTFGSFLLPRISMFYKVGPKFSFRLAAGTGYKTPSIFDVAEPSSKLSSVNKDVASEKSTGLNSDINYHTILFDELRFELNQAFYYTNIRHPIILTSDANGTLITGNGMYEVNSYGTDTYIRLVFDDLELYLGYNHTESFQLYDSITYNMPFNPKDKLSGTLAYEIEGKWRMGVEASYSGNQYIYNNKKVPNFLFMAAVIERKFKRANLVLNCENLLDVRQTQFEPIVEGSRQNPIYKPLWGPIEGRVINLSIKIKI